MANALEQFRAQREAAEQVLVKVQEVSVLLTAVRQQAAALASDQDLRAVIASERQLLREAESAVATIRAFREAERHRFWPAVWRRWSVAFAFALLSAAAAGAGYARATAPYAEEIQELRLRVEFADLIARRVLTMTATERRQFDALMRKSADSQR